MPESNNQTMIHVAFDGERAAEMYCGPVADISVGILSPTRGIRVGSKVPWSFVEKYNGLCCKIAGHYDFPNESTFDRMDMLLNGIAEVAVYHQRPNPTQSNVVHTRHRGLGYSTHAIYFTGDILQGLQALQGQSIGLDNHAINSAVWLVEQRLGRARLAQRDGGRNRNRQSDPIPAPSCIAADAGADGRNPSPA